MIFASVSIRLMLVILLNDTYILFVNNKLKTIETVINTELKLVSTWLRLNRLSLNEGKSELIIFHSKKNIPKFNEISIKLNGKKLIPVNSVKYLGMYIDKHLSWDTHIFHLSQKLSRANGILSKLRHNSPREVSLDVYYALFYSHLIYGCNLLGIILLLLFFYLSLIKNIFKNKV